MKFPAVSACDASALRPPCCHKGRPDDLQAYRMRTSWNPTGIDLGHGCHRPGLRCCPRRCRAENILRRRNMLRAQHRPSPHSGGERGAGSRPGRALRPDGALLADVPGTDLEPGTWPW